MLKSYEVSSLSELRSRVMDVMLDDWEGKFSDRLQSFAAFLGSRIKELTLWPKGLTQLRLLISNGPDKVRFKPGQQRTRQNIVDYNLTTPKLNDTSDDALIASFGEACAEVFGRFMPGVNLSVLADEFLSAGCKVRFTHRAEQKAVSARLALTLGMRRLEADLQVSAKKTKRYPVVTLSAEQSWLNLFGSLIVTPRQVVVRAIPNEFTVVIRRGRRRVLDNGSAATVRRFVVNVDAKGSQRLVQQWEHTGSGGVAEKGTRLT